MPLAPNPNVFANNPLNRASDRRGDEAWLAAQRADARTRVIPFFRLQPLVFERAGSDGETGWLTWSAIEALGLKDPPTIFLGLDGDCAHFAVDLSAGPDPLEKGPLQGLGQWADLRFGAAALPAADIAILGQAKALIDWHARHGYCANCGQPTRASEAGYKRICAGCKAEHFPRTDPVVIMLATLGGRALLGRQNRFPPRMYSALAGFIEPGESIEEAVAREIKEEAGVEIKSVRYHSTQPWPFPSSLMIGCLAEAASEAITVDGVELSEARWFSREELGAALERGPRGAGPFFVPPSFAIAHQLIKAFVQEG